MTETNISSGTHNDQPCSCPGQACRRGFILLGCGIAAGPVFFTIFSIAGALRRLQHVRHLVSSLEFGPDGWVLLVNFLLTGILVALFGVRCVDA